MPRAGRNMSGLGSRAWVLGAVVVGLATVGITGLVLAGDDTPAGLKEVGQIPAGLKELGQIESVIRTYEEASLPELPPGLATLQDTTAKWRRQVSADYAVVMDEVSVPSGQFARNYRAADPRLFLEAELARADEEGMPTQYEVKVLAVEYRRTLPSSDVVVWAKVWVGSKKATQFDPETGQAAAGRGIDNLPVIEFVMRHVDGRWRIVDLNYVDFGPDSSPAEYGPDTPHGSELNPDADVLGRSTSPSPAAPSASDVPGN